MDQIRILPRRIGWLFKMVSSGEFEILAVDFSMRVYRALFFIVFHLKLAMGSQPKCRSLVTLKTEFPVAFESPDHLVPWGTANDNSSNKKFVLFMDDLVSRQVGARDKRFLDLGCSGGQLVKDFLDMGWTAVGLEGSDFSQKHQRANWPLLGGKNLFTCDLTKPFDLRLDGKPAQFQIITAWEVLEHIPQNDLESLFRTISRLLAPDGYFIASTTAAPDIHDGIDLHQTKMTNAQWRDWVQRNVKELQHVELGLKYYQFVRFNYRERSFITCRKLAERTQPE